MFSWVNTSKEKGSKTLPLLLLKEMIRGRGLRKEKKKNGNSKDINMFVRMSPIFGTEVKLFMAFVVLTFISKQDSKTLLVNMNDT